MYHSGDREILSALFSAQEAAPANHFDAHVAAAGKVDSRNEAVRAAEEGTEGTLLKREGERVRGRNSVDKSIVFPRGFREAYTGTTPHA